MSFRIQSTNFLYNFLFFLYSLSRLRDSEALLYKLSTNSTCELGPSFSALHTLNVESQELLQRYYEPPLLVLPRLPACLHACWVCASLSVFFLVWEIYYISTKVLWTFSYMSVFYIPFYDQHLVCVYPLITPVLSNLNILSFFFLLDFVTCIPSALLTLLHVYFLIIHFITCLFVLCKVNNVYNFSSLRERPHLRKIIVDMCPSSRNVSQG